MGWFIGKDKIFEVGDIVNLASCIPPTTRLDEMVGTVKHVLTGGKKVRVAWGPNGEPVTQDADNLVLIERPARPGSVILGDDIDAYDPVQRVALSTPGSTLPLSSAERKEVPLFRGLLRYFPAALAWTARISKLGNDKHNPGEEMHHSRGKSSDHADCILRHMMDLDADYGKGKGRDENGVPQVGYVVWRALALAQEWLEATDGAPFAPGAKK